MEIQECILAPTRLRTYSEAMQASVEAYFGLARILTKRYGKAALNVGDDGEYTPYIKKAEDGLSLIQKAVEIPQSPLPSNPIPQVAYTCWIS